jgi:hypothetical protein
MDASLLPAEREELARAEQIMAAEEEGLGQEAIAERCGLPFEKFRAFLRTQKYRIYRKYLSEQLAVAEDDLSADRKRSERRRWDKHAKNALDYYDQAFRRHTASLKIKGRPPIAKGDFVDPDRAERAAQMVAKAQGWTEPVAAHAKPRDLKVGVIQQRMDGIAAADRRETVVTPVTNGARITCAEDAPATVMVADCDSKVPRLSSRF